MMSGVKCVVALEHFRQESGCVQAVGTAALARVAVDAVFNTVHFRVPFVG